MDLGLQEAPPSLWDKPRASMEPSSAFWPCTGKGGRTQDEMSSSVLGKDPQRERDRGERGEVGQRVSEPTVDIPEHLLCASLRPHRDASDTVSYM